jgi:hypothetical protein
MRHRITALFLAAGSVALIPGLAAAVTATTWTVTPGGQVTAASVTKLELTDHTTGRTLPCKNSSWSGTFRSGSGLSGTHLAAINSLSLSTCTGPGSVKLTITGSGFPWYLNALAYSGSTGTTTGKITGVHLVLTGSGCSAVVDGTSSTAFNGTVKVRFTSPAQLKLLPTGGNLHFYQVTGCATSIASGDPAQLTGTYTISPAQTITSP